jgi:hypothetical protein
MDKGKIQVINGLRFNSAKTKPNNAYVYIGSPEAFVKA